jgi:chitinase
MKRLRALFLFDLAVTGILLLGISQPASAQTQACAAPWQVGISITVGEVLSYGGHNWKAIQGGYTTIDGWQPPNTPALWTDLGVCGGGTPTPTPTPPPPTPTPTPTPTPPPPTPTPTPTGGGGSCAPAWNATTIYSAPGTTVSRNGVNYQNAFWTQGDDPATHSGPAGSGQPWIPIGTCSSCSTLAAAPGKPTASGTTFNSTNLSWPAVSAPANCSITGYTVLKNGSSIGTTTSTSFTVNGLTAQTTFNFTVEANDGAGSSAPSAAVSVTTPACSGSCSTGHATFASYKDVTLNADFNTGLQRSAVTGTVQPVTAAMPNQTLIWAFATGTCDAENWAGITPAMEATNVQAFVNAGKHYIISTGGANGAFDCSSGQGMINFINRYNSANLVGIDFDIELGQSQQIIDDLINATKAAMVQFPNLQFSFTIQSLGSLNANPITGGSVGTTVVNEIKRLGLSGNYVVNLMTFDYGSTTVNNCVVVNNTCDMGNSAIAAAQALNQQSGIPFSHIGITMMIGKADTQDEITSLHDIDTINAFVISNGLPVSRFWSFDRDTPNGTGNNNSNGNGVPVLAYTREFMSSLGVP